MGVLVSLAVETNDGSESRDTYRRQLNDIAYEDIPAALAAAHTECSPGDNLSAEFTLTRSRGAQTARDRPPPDLDTLMIGAGFELLSGRHGALKHGEPVAIEAVRLRTLPDYLAPGMSMVICGLNPSLHSADMGVGFGRGGNRFWPAALAAGLVTTDRDPSDALARHGVGMTDMVKRASPRAASLTSDEYRAGVDRLSEICRWLQPGLVCMVGLAGWRAAVDRHARAGLQAETLGGSAVYVMPSTSGLNAHSSLSDLTDHLSRAADLAASTTG